MKITLAILCLFAGWVRAAVPGTGLVADYNAALGVTESGGLVSQWNDQHQTLNADGLGPHNATQATGASKPTLVTDFQGNPGILFPWDLSPSHPNTFLTIPTSLTGMATRSLSVYAVMSHWHKDNPTAIFSLSSGQFMSLWSISSSPKRPAVWDQVAPTLYIPSNKSILATVGRASGSVVQWNDTRVTLSTVGSATGLSGGEIGREASSSSRWFSGIIYRLLIYNVPHTNAEVDAVVNALEAEHSVTMSYTNQIVCRGDSLTEGYGETALRSYPLQLNELLPTWKMYMYGSSGQQIGDSGTSNQMYNMDSAAIDPLFDGTMTRNVLAFMGGTNDINAGGLTGAQTFTRLTGYLTARKAAHAWETMVGTLPDRGTLDTQVGDYNTLIRTGDSTIDRIADYGKASSIETRLNLSTNATYFNADGVHLTNAGYGVIAEQNNARLFPMTIPAASASRADVGPPNWCGRMATP